MSSPYTVIGYLDLFNIHTVYEHVEAVTSEHAISEARDTLKRTNPEYASELDDGNDALTVIAVFNGHLTEND